MKLIQEEKVRGFKETCEIFVTNLKHKRHCQVTENACALLGKPRFHKACVSLQADLWFGKEDMQALQFQSRGQAPSCETVNLDEPPTPTPQKQQKNNNPNPYSFSTA